MKIISNRKVNIAFLLLFITIIGISSFVFYQNKNLKKKEASQFYNSEKVADGVWLLKNRDPIHQVLASGKDVSGKVDLSLKESIGEYKWTTKLASGTFFSFGKQEQAGILPIVRIVNKDGYFVQYSPKNFKGVVTPKVKGNVVEWEIADGITIRYTMMSDRVKEDYIISSKSQIPNFKIDFNVISGNINNKPLIGELMPDGDIAWFTGSEEVMNTQFSFPKPIVKDNAGKEIKSSYAFTKDKDGVYSLAIVLDPKQAATAVWPLTIDPAVIDTSTTINSITAYDNQRKLMRDPWGNLIAVLSTAGSITNRMIWYKNYDSTSWVDSGIDLCSAAVICDYLTGDLDSAFNVQLIKIHNSGGLRAIEYRKLTVSRNSSNKITGISASSGLTLQASAVNASVYPPSMIVANKGGGAGVEKIAVALEQNFNTPRTEIRFMQCDVADDCTTAANWKNASEEINGSGSCSDSATSGAAGLPATNCKGTTDKLFNVAAANIAVPVLVQMPGKPKRSPTNVVKDLSGVQTNLTNVIDNSTGTTDAVNSLTTTDYIYVGDDKPFSKVTFDLTNTNSNAQTFSTKEYWNGASWTSVSNYIDNTATATIGFSEDGSMLFDEPSNWATTSVNGSTKYWVRFRPSGALDASVSIAEIYITDRNSKALLVVGGDDGTDDLRAAYVPWDEVSNSGWENRPDSVGIPWRQDAAGANSALSDTGANLSTFSQYPLSATLDYKNNTIYVAYMEGTAVGSSDITVKYLPTNKDPTVAANWTNTSFPTTTESSGTNISLTSDGSDIYMFYVLNSASTSIVWRKCTPSGGGDGNKCDNASDWGSENTLISGSTNNYPQVLMTKITGDTAAFDVLYTSTVGPTVYAERHYVNLADKTVTVSASGDDAYHRQCASTSDDQDISSASAKLGPQSVDASCPSTVNSNNHAGFRFPNITVAQGAKISSAYIDFRINSVVGPANTPIAFTVYGIDTDNAISAGSSFTASTDVAQNTSTLINNLSKTTSSYPVSYNFSTNTYRIDVTNIVQELVCRGAANSQPCVGNFNKSGSWASGNAIGILLIDTNANSTQNYILIDAQDGTPSLSPTLQINLGTTGKSYSVGSATQLATGSASFQTNLDHPLSAIEMSAVSTSDSKYASVSATTNYASSSAVPAFMFKVNNSNNNNTYTIGATGTLQSSLATSLSPIYLQVYRGGATNDWVTMASDNITAADTALTLTSPTISASTTDYYFNETPGVGTQYAACTTGTTNCWTYWRIYQDTPGTNLNAILNLDYFNVTFSAGGGGTSNERLRGGTRLRAGTRLK